MNEEFVFFVKDTVIIHHARSGDVQCTRIGEVLPFQVRSASTFVVFGRNAIRGDN